MYNAVTANQDQIWIIAPPGRKRESLVTLLSSIKDLTNIQIVESCRQILDAVRPTTPSLIMIDYQNPDSTINKEIETIFLRYPHSRFILLKNHTGHGTPFITMPNYAVIYGEITVSVLRQLLLQNEVVLESGK